MPPRPFLSGPRLSAAAALRRLADVLVSREVDDGLLTEIAAFATTAAGRAEAAPARGTDAERAAALAAWRLPDEGKEVARHFPDCFVCGPGAPAGAAVTVRRDGSGVVAEVLLGEVFRGVPGRAHGGAVAAVFDDLMAQVPPLSGRRGFTVELTLRFREAVPLHTPVEFRAGLERQDGRKMVVAGTAIHAGRLLVEAEGLFIAPA